jgi:O-antigen/teichoic acid export membrane protein
VVVALGRQVTREASVYLVGFVVAALLQFLAVPIFTRALGPESYSYLALALALTTSLAGVLLLGGDVALSRLWFAADDEESRRDLALTWIAFLTLWSIVVVLILAPLAKPLAEWLEPGTELSAMLVVGLAILVPQQLSRMLAQVLRNQFRPVAFAVTTIAIAALGLILSLILGLALDLGVLGILLGTLVAEILGVLVRFPIVRAALAGRLRTRMLGPPLRFGLPLVPASIAMWAFTGADRIVVGRYLPAGELGAYSVAAMLVAPFGVLLTALGQAWIPRITQEYEVGGDRAATMTGRAVELSLLVFGGAAVLVGVAAPLLITVVAGPGYAAGAPALPFLALGGAFLGTSLFSSTGYTLAKRTGWVPVITLLAAAVNVILLLVLVPLLGLVGAALAVASGYLVMSVGLLLYSQRHYPVPVSWAWATAVASVLAAQALLATYGSPAAFMPGALVTITLLAARAWHLVRPTATTVPSP